MCILDGLDYLGSNPKLRKRSTRINRVLNAHPSTTRRSNRTQKQHSEEQMRTNEDSIYLVLLKIGERLKYARTGT